ncbi:two-component system activity regulator YycH [Paenibacillus sp. LHD-117]|uniref:YycH family regulatory protein n=1 Tax=Paenibacillus sp. LHD-117 TaxID=3071412 RepID=UPI0027E206C9|nr:two-component system activity regulator YycH [Paenibacillus sp. LHD-117]MDQ6421923.1 two-component system activity regulator YycH [Paenibacillus sp. LHD-117]
MMERMKTGVLIALVALSLLQSYLLAYSMPGLGATVRSDQDYVNAEPLGTSSHVENTIFPEELIIHMGGDKHTVIYPNTQFYEMILEQRLMGREFKGFQRGPITLLDWNEVRKNDIGIELRFGNGIAVDLLQKLLKLEGDLLFLNDKIDRIWIFKTTETEEIRTFFFSSEDGIVYESVRADLTVRDVQDYVGFGQHLPNYRMTDDGLYVPKEPLQAKEMVFPYEMYSPEQMQRSLFFDPSTTRAIVDRSGAQIFTDGKRGLKVEQNGLWINYTNPAATQSNEVMLSENVYASVDFVNQNGGWDGVHALIGSAADEEAKLVTFRKYLEQYPVMIDGPFKYGYIQLTLQQGDVTEYSRSLITLGEQSESRTVRWLPGGEALEERLQRYARRGEVSAMFPALKAIPMENKRLSFEPVWAVRLSDGTEEVLAEAYPAGYTPPVETPASGGNVGNDPASGGDGEGGETAEGQTGEETAVGGASGETTENQTGLDTTESGSGNTASVDTRLGSGLTGAVVERFGSAGDL